jgi:pyrroline-5-carboxylate reductase
MHVGLIRHGMPAVQAATLVNETMAGTAALLNQNDTPADAVVNG